MGDARRRTDADLVVGQLTCRSAHRTGLQWGSLIAPRRDQRSPLEPGPVSRPTRQLTDDQIRIGATAGIAHVAIALVAHFAVPVSLAPRLGLVADPWFRRETGTVNAGFAYGLLQGARGRRGPTFLRATAI